VPATPVEAEPPQQPPLYLVKEEPRQEEPAAAAPAPVSKLEEQRQEEPKIDANEYLSSAGLVMIETDRSKAPPPQAESVEQPMARGRPRRARSKPPAEDDELVQVETRK
jgi:hypothetical protein